MTTDTYPVPDYPGLLRLDGKGFIVAGGGLGMGRQTSHALAQCGAKVAVVDIDPDRAATVAEQVGGTALTGDMTKRGDVERVITEAEASLGRIDGLVDIIGLAEWASVLDMDDDMWARQFDKCLRHAYLLGQNVGKRLVARGGGTMVFVASVSGLDSAPNHAAYGAAKAGLMAWVRSLAVELGGSGVRVNAVAPGAIRTPRLYGFDPDTSDVDRATSIVERAPLARIGETRDIAGAALFLSSGLSAYVTGRTLVVDGGVDVLFMGNPPGQLPGT